MTTILTPAQAQHFAAALIAARHELHGDARMDATTGTGADGATDGQPDANGTKPAGDGEPEETPEEKATRLEAELAESKKHSRTWEDRAKANKDKAKSWDEAQAANATPDQKLTAAEERATKAETELARYKVAHETQLPASLLSLLNGDEDQMRDQAKALMEFKGETKPKGPKPDPTQGGQPKKTTSKADDGRAEAQRRYGKPAA